MLELFDDFRDILVERHEADARFVVLGGHAVAFQGQPRATKNGRATACPQDLADVGALDAK